MGMHLMTLFAGMSMGIWSLSLFAYVQQEMFQISSLVAVAVITVIAFTHLLISIYLEGP